MFICVFVPYTTGFILKPSLCMFAFAGFRKLFHSKFDLTISSFVHYTIQLLYASPE